MQLLSLRVGIPARREITSACNHVSSCSSFYDGNARPHIGIRAIPYKLCSHQHRLHFVLMLNYRGGSGIPVKLNLVGTGHYQQAACAFFGVSRSATLCPKYSPTQLRGSRLLSLRLWEVVLILYLFSFHFVLCWLLTQSLVHWLLLGQFMRNNQFYYSSWKIFGF